MNNDWKPTEQNIGQPVLDTYSASVQNSTYIQPQGNLYIHNPKLSNWNCYMFGNRPGGSGIIYTPQEGRVPNRFVRLMMRICFDCKWVKNDK